MGSFGSGRKAGYGRDKVERRLTIDINVLHRTGCLKPGRIGAWRWIINGEPVDITLRAEENHLHIGYDGDGLTQQIDIIRFRRNLGGSQAYFKCPQCSRVASKLHAAEQGRFLCRHCCRLGYSSQWEDGYGLAVRRARKIAGRLGRNPGLPFPSRPKWQHHRTHVTLLWNAITAELAIDKASTEKIEKLLRRVEVYKQKHSNSSGPAETDSHKP